MEFVHIQACLLMQHGIIWYWKLHQSDWCNQSGPQKHFKPQYYISMTIVTRGLLIVATNTFYCIGIIPLSVSNCIMGCVWNQKWKCVLQKKKSVLSSWKLHIVLGMLFTWYMGEWAVATAALHNCMKDILGWKILLTFKFWHCFSSLVYLNVVAQTSLCWGPLKVSVDQTPWTFFNDSLL